jgi:Flp pilus assembly protein TadG
MTSPLTRVGRDRGSAAAELVLVTPLLVALLSSFVLGGQLLLARQQLDDAARTAVEAAVDGRSPAAAVAEAKAAAHENLFVSKACTRAQLTVGTGRFRAGGDVSVAISCRVVLPPLPFLPLKRALVIASSSWAGIEPYRAVSR